MIFQSQLFLICKSIPRFSRKIKRRMHTLVYTNKKSELVYYSNVEFGLVLVLSFFCLVDSVFKVKYLKLKLNIQDGTVQK